MTGLSGERLYLRWSRGQGSGMCGIDSRSGLPLRMREGCGALVSALHGLKLFGEVRASLCRSASTFLPHEVAARRALLTIEFDRTPLRLLPLTYTQTRPTAAGE